MKSAKIIYIHRNKSAGFSIEKVTQTIIRGISDKEEHYVPCSTAGIADVIKNMLYCWRLRNKEQIFHITGDIHYCILPLIGCKTILTIHDTVLMDYLEYSIIKRILVKWMWYKLPLMFADKVVCISETTKHKILAISNRKDIVVIHDALDSSFKQSDRKCDLSMPTILMIGTNPNKNLLRTFAALKDINCRLMVIGRLTEEQLNFLKINKINYNNKTNLTDEEIIEEYEKADIVSFISLFEGFGMIVIEANKIGRPVICSDIPVLREVAADAALFVNPIDVEAMKEGFIKLMNNPELCETLVAKGHSNALRFDADKIREQWIKLYNFEFGK